MLYVQIPVMLNNFPSTLHVVDKANDKVSDSNVWKLVNAAVKSGKVSKSMADNPQRLFDYVYSHRCKSYPDMRIKSSQRDVWLIGTDINIKVDARDLVVIGNPFPESLRRK